MKLINFLLFSTLTLLTANLLHSQCSKAIKYSTFQGGNGDEEIIDLYVHPVSKYIYTIAKTTSTNLTGTTINLGSSSGLTYVQCMNNNGTLRWATILNGMSKPMKIFADDSNNPILLAETDYPYNSMPGPGADKSFNGPSDLVYLKLNPLGTNIIASSYIGGNGLEEGRNTNAYDFRYNTLYGMARTTSSDIAITSTAISSQPGELYIFSYSTMTNNFLYNSYFKYCYKEYLSEALTVSPNGELYLYLANKSNIDSEFAGLISPNAIISNFQPLSYNYFHILLELNSNYQRTYGTYINDWIQTGEVIDNPLTMHIEYSPFSGVPGILNDEYSDIEVDSDGNLYLVRTWSSFKSAIFADNTGEFITNNIFGESGHTNKQSLPNILKLNKNSLTGNFNLSYIHYLYSVDKINIELDNQDYMHCQTTLGLTNNLSTSTYYTESIQSVFLNDNFNSSYIMFSNDAHESNYDIGLNFGNVFSNVFINGNDIYLYGSSNATHPVTPSWRDYDLNSQIVVQQSNFGGGNNDGFITVIHTPSPSTTNQILDFPSGANTFCRNSNIDINNQPLSSVPSQSYGSGDGSSVNHIVPDYKIENQVFSHPVPWISFQWQKSYDNITWTDIPGENQETYYPASEANSGNVYYRRRVINCNGGASNSNTIQAIISNTNNTITVASGSTKYNHCPGTPTPLTVNVTGGGTNLSWQWYNGYALTSDITPASGTGSSITATVNAITQGGGVYRLVVKNNATGCEREAFFNVVVPRVNMENSFVLCPGTSSISIGPNYQDPNFIYKWTGPNNFTSNIANPTINNPGTYVLTVNQCPGTAQSVQVVHTPHHPSLVALGSTNDFCQYGPSRVIGLNTPEPPGYTFQWAPTLNISDITVFKPTYDPLVAPTPNNPQSYTLAALRQSDKCLYETTTNIRVIPNADIKGPIDNILCDGVETLDAQITGGTYFEWKIVSTTFAGGVNTLKIHPNFRFNNVQSESATVKNPVLQYPNNTNYTITFVIKASGSPLTTSNTCYTEITVTYFVFSNCNGNTVCFRPVLTSSGSSGDLGTCGSENTILTASAALGSSVVWSIQSTEPATAPTNPLYGLFDLNNIALTNAMPQPNQVIANLDFGPTSIFRRITYRVSVTGPNGYICYDTIRVYSKRLNSPLVDLIPTFNACQAINSTLLEGKGIPLQMDNTFHNGAANSNIIWSWTHDSQGSLNAANVRYPIVTSGESSRYFVKATDKISGCFKADTINIIVNKINGDAGTDIPNACRNTTVILGAGDISNQNTYVWSPPAGLNFPLGTPNTTVPRPFATIGNAGITYTLVTSRNDCKVRDQIQIALSNTPPSVSNATFAVCVGNTVSLETNADINCPACTYSWSVISGGQLSWLSNPNAAEPIFTLPSNYNGPNVITYNLTVSKGDCGSAGATITVNVNNVPAPTLPNNLSIGCSTPLIALNITNHTSGTSYNWEIVGSPSSPVLYTNANMTGPFNGGVTAANTLYPFTTNQQFYKVTAIKNGCSSLPVEIKVTNTSNLKANGGLDKSLCTTGDQAILGGGTYPAGSNISWTLVGFASDPLSNVFSAPTAAQVTQAIGFLSSTSTASPTITRPNSVIGAYQYRIRVTLGMCTSEDIVIVRFPNNTFPINAIINTNIACTGSCFSLLNGNPIPGISYSWSAFPPSAGNISNPNAPNPTACPSGNVAYSLTMTNMLTGCKSATQTAAYSVYTAPPINENVKIEVCNYNTPINLTAYYPNYNTYTTKTWRLFNLPVSNSGSTIITNPTTFIPNGFAFITLEVTNQFGCSSTSILTIVNPEDEYNEDKFHYLTGHEDKNIATKIKFIDGDVFLAYQHFKGNEYYGGLARYNRDGTVVWNKLLSYPSKINDFIKDDNCNIIAVGHKGLFNVSTYNTSMVVTFDRNTGNQVLGKEISRNGREEFKKIIKSSVVNGEYLMSGTSNISTTIDNSDVPAITKYTTTATALANIQIRQGTNTDIESDRGILDLLGNRVLLMGNEGLSGRGTFTLLNTASNTILTQKTTDLKIDFYDGIKTTDSKVILIGDKFDTDEGVIVVLDDNLNFVSYYNYPKHSGFREIHKKSDNEYFILCRSKENLPRVTLFSFRQINGIITNNLGYFIDDLDKNLQSYWFDYDPFTNNIAYVDTREVVGQTGFGNLDMFIGVFDDKLTLECTKETVIPNVRKSLILSNATYTAQTANNTVTNISSILPNSYKTSDITCECKYDKEPPILSAYFNERTFQIGPSKMGTVDYSEFLISATDNCSEVKLDLPQRKFDCTDVGNLILITIKAIDENSNISQIQLRVKITDPNNYCNLSGGGTGSGNGDGCNTVMDFDGKDDYIALNSPLKQSKDFTAEMWVLSDQTITSNCSSNVSAGLDWIVSFGDNDFGLIECNGQLKLVYKPMCPIGNGLCSNLPSRNLDDGLWHHIALTMSPTGGLKIYFDGDILTTLSGVNYDYKAIIRLGNNFPDNNIGESNHWKGRIDEFRIWNTFRSATQIKENYKCKSLQDQSIVLNYNFEEGTGDQNNMLIDSCENVFKDVFDGRLHNFRLDESFSNYVCDTLRLKDCSMTSGDCPHPDYVALRDLYNSTNGSQWTNTIAGDKPWLVDCDPCGLVDGTPWKGIQCNNMGRVDVLDLNNNNLVGSLPSSIGQLSDLEWFNVNRNNLSGTIPSEFCNLTKMLHFVISNNIFNGDFPSCFANFTSLVRIVANNNKFTGPLPNLGGSAQSGLINLHYDNNKFTGSIPSNYGNLTNLNYLSVANNNLSGCYPQLLSTFCSDPDFTSNSNTLISDGNNFNATWSQFCATGAGSCTVSTSDLDVPNILVYPNPVTQTLYFYNKGQLSEYDTKVFDNTGRMYPLKPLKLQNGVESLDVSSLVAGIYFLKFENSNNILFTKFIKID